MRRLLLPALLACLAAGGATPAAAGAASNRPLVLAITLNTEINPVSASFVSDSINRAQSEHAAALVILMDTPGGDSDSMNRIVQDELASPVPVIVYVSPAGARAASAGSVITMGSDLAAMAPATHIGAATPIQSSGANIGSDLRRKILNDSEKQMQALAQSHGRNAKAAVEIVSQAKEFTDTEALHQNLVEFLAPSLPALLNEIDGTTTTYTAKVIVLHTAHAEVQTYDMPWTLQLLNILIDPNLLYILFLAGLGGLAYEAFHPGVILPGTLGAVSLILALFGFSIVPINWAGAVLIAFGVALLLMEAFVTSHGLIGLSGVIAICVGGLMLFRTPGSGAGVSPLLVIGLGAAFGAALALVATKVLAARRSPPSRLGGGAPAMLGLTGVARTPLHPDGQVFVRGELWQAESDAEVPAGAPVVVREVEGLVLRVSRTEEPAGGGPAP
ncbi:MAG TPA: nodulation protein NfeD [Gaiellales bacterium]|jgi:membrane-bound serine protease (ClpP class)|nr:nodulation protein NfeD [Gaiellales bacterium]